MAVRSHKVHTEDGRDYRRNRSHLYKVPEKWQPISDVKAVKSERTSRNPIPSYVVQRTRSVSRYFLIYSCTVLIFDGEVLKETYFHILFILCVVQRNNIAFSSVLKDNKNSLLRYSFLPKKETNKQNKNKKKTKKHSSSLLILNWRVNRSYLKSMIQCFIYYDG